MALKIRCTVLLLLLLTLQNAQGQPDEDESESPTRFVVDFTRPPSSMNNRPATNAPNSDPFASASNDNPRPVPTPKPTVFQTPAPTFSPLDSLTRPPRANQSSLNVAVNDPFSPTSPTSYTRPSAEMDSGDYDVDVLEDDKIIYEFGDEVTMDPSFSVSDFGTAGERRGGDDVVSSAPSEQMNSTP